MSRSPPLVGLHTRKSAVFSILNHPFLKSCPSQNFVELDGEELHPFTSSEPMPAMKQRAQARSLPRMDALTTAQWPASANSKYRNANGAHIYFRPSGESRYTLLDDLSLAAIASLTAEDFEPCAVVEASRDNFQAG